MTAKTSSIIGRHRGGPKGAPRYEWEVWTENGRLVAQGQTILWITARLAARHAQALWFQAHPAPINTYGPLPSPR